MSAALVVPVFGVAISRVTSIKDAGQSVQDSGRAEQPLDREAFGGISRRKCGKLRHVGIALGRLPVEGRVVAAAGRENIGVNRRQALPVDTNQAGVYSRDGTIATLRAPQR